MINVNRNCPDAFEMSLICNLILRTAMFEALNEILVFNIAPQCVLLLQVVRLCCIVPEY